jgi:E3 ubiquitin-protein ligase Topors
MDDDEKMEEMLDEAGLPVLSIRGAAKVEPVSSSARLSLLERLAKAKTEAAALNGAPLTPIFTVKWEVPLKPLTNGDVPTISDPTLSPGAALKSPGVRAIVQARLRLRLKLASEKKVFVYNQNESKAQELRRMLLEARARREADETDAVLRKLDKVDRAREVRRRLMVEKMMAAETESERRARELKERLMGERRAKGLRETLRKRKSGQEGVAPAITVR